MLDTRLLSWKGKVIVYQQNWMLVFPMRILERVQPFFTLFEF